MVTKMTKKTLMQVLMAASLIALSWSVAPVTAKAYFANRQEMVERADLIVLAQIGKVQASSQPARPFNFSEEAQAKVIKTIKGSCPEEIRVLGGENFICARFHIQSGKAILFLNKTEGGYKGANWHLSEMLVIKENDEEVVRMAESAYDRSTEKTIKLSEAMKKIKDDLEKANVLAQSPPYIKTLFSATIMYSSAIGESGSTSQEYEAYKKLMEELSKDKGESKYVNLLVSYGSAPAKLYAISALARTNPIKAKVLLKDLRNSKETVQYQSGCKGITESLGTIAEAFLDKGRYLDFELGQK